MTRASRSISVALLIVLAAPPKGWFGTDKVKHFLVSFLVHSSTYSVSRAARVSRPQASAVGVASALAVGVLKEVRDKRAGSAFSVADLVWDGAGTAASAALLKRSR